MRMRSRHHGQETAPEVEAEVVEVEAQGTPKGRLRNGSRWAADRLIVPCPLERLTLPQVTGEWTPAGSSGR